MVKVQVGILLNLHINLISIEIKCQNFIFDLGSIIRKYIEVEFRVVKPKRIMVQTCNFGSTKTRKSKLYRHESGRTWFLIILPCLFNRSD